MQEKKITSRAVWHLVFACMLFAALACGCVRQNENVTEITLVHGWGSTEPDHVAMRQIYQDFEKENPDIHINLVSMPTTDELLRKVEDSIMVGDIPDVIFLAGQGRDSVFRYMVEHGYALDLMPYVEEDSEFRWNLAPVNLKYWTTEDHRLFTVSDVLIMSGGYWYNEDIFRAAGVEQLPSTWEEFETVCAQILSWAEREHNDVKALQLSTEGYLGFASLMLAQKGVVSTRAGMPIDQEDMMETLSALERIHYYSISGGGGYNYRDETSLFNDGKLAIYVNGVWGASMIRSDLNVSYALLPSGASGICCESSGVGYVLGDTGDTEREEASVRFLKYMMSPGVQERIVLETQQVAANPNIQIEAYEQQMPRFCQAVKQVQASRQKIEVPSKLWSNRQFSVFQENIMAVLSGKMNKQTLIDLLKR